MNRVGSGFAVGGTDTLRIIPYSVASTFSGFTMTNVNKAMAMAERHLRAIAVAAFAVVLVSATWVGIPVTLRVAGVVRVPDVRGDLLESVVRRGQITVDSRRCLERGRMTAGG